MLATTINRYLGSSAASECRVPAGAVVCEFKYCEVCGRPFVREFAPTVPFVQREQDASSWGRKVFYSQPVTRERRRDHGARFCKGCRGRHLEPDVAAQEAYREQLPNDRETKKRRVYQMPDYRSLNPVGRATASHKMTEASAPPRRGKRHLSQLERDKWQACVKALLRERPATLEELCELIPNAATPQEAAIRLRYAAIRLSRVGDAPRRVESGPHPGLFALAPELVN